VDCAQDEEELSNWAELKGTSGVPVRSKVLINVGFFCLAILQCVAITVAL
jgi:hypothetical protein